MRPFVTEHKIKLKKGYRKVLALYAAYNNTFVFRGVKGQRQDCIVHVNADGKILQQIVFKKPIEALEMLSDKQCITLQTRENCITVFDLQTRQYYRVPFLFMNEESDQANLFSFAETKYLCVQQRGRYNDNRYKLTYFKYPLKKGINEPLCVYKPEDNEWTYEYLTRRANAKSMVCWWKPRTDQAFSFRVYELLTGNKGQYSCYSFKQKIGSDANNLKVACAVLNMWSMKKGQFLCVCISNKASKYGEGKVNNNYVCNVQTQTIRESKFTFSGFQDALIDCYSLGKVSMFRTFKFQEHKPMTTPIYYVDNETETIIAQQSWQCSYLHKYQFPGSEPDTLYEGLYTNGDVQQFTLQIKKVPRLRQIHLHLLLHLSVQFEDDLLLDVINLIDYEHY